MPTYVYETISEQPRRFEVEQRMSDEPLQTDPETGLPVRRVITGGIGLLAGGLGSSPAYEPSMGAGSCCGGMCGCG